MHRRLVLWGVSFALLTVGCGPPKKKKSGPDWSPSFEAQSFGWVMSVSGASPKAVWAVGGTPDDGAMKHFDGSEWSDVALPDGVGLLNWVHAFDEETVVAAANDGIVLQKTEDGWTKTATPTDEDLWGIWGASPEDLWAVGGSGRMGSEATIVRNRGNGWETVQVPELERSNVRAFFKVWGTGKDNIYIVGQSGALLHWDGQALEEELVGTSRDLISVWGTGPDNVVAVGGRGNGVVAHWDGSKWQSTSVAPLPGVNGIWMHRPEQAWVAMERGKVGRLDLSGDEPVIEETQLETPMSVHAVFGFPGGSIHAVGGSLRSPEPPYRGIAYTRKTDE